MKKPAGLLVSIILILVLTTSPAVSVNNQALIKDETVYANLNADGSIEHIYVVNRIETKEEGVYTDYGHYTSVLSLSSNQQPVIAGDEIRWQKTDDVIYYQGQLDQGELPFTFALAYTLNGDSVAAQEAIGKSGTIAINISVLSNEKAKDYFRENYVAQIQIPLNLEKAVNIVAPGAVSVITGKTANLAYTVLPGQKASFTLQFDTDKFQLEPITFACTPFDISTFNINTPEIADGLGQLTDGLDQLIGGSKQLKQGLGDLAIGLDDLSEGANQVAEGTSALAGNIPVLLNGVGGLQQGALALNAGIGQLSIGAGEWATRVADLATGVEGYTAAAWQIHGKAQALDTGLSQLSSQGEELSSGYAGLAAGMATTITGLPDQLTDLNLTSQQQQALGQILASMAEGLATQFDSFGEGLQGYTAGVSQFSQGMGELTLGLEGYASEGQGVNEGAQQVSESTADFIQGLSQMQTGSGELAAGITTFANESQALSSGSQELSSGANALAEGMQEMADGAQGLPSSVQSLIDGQYQVKEGFLLAGGMLADYELPQGKVQRESFVSNKGTPRSVQFVASTPALRTEIQEAPEPKAPEEKVGFFARLLNLFKKND